MITAEAAADFVKLKRTVQDCADNDPECVPDLARTDPEFRKLACKLAGQANGLLQSHQHADGGIIAPVGTMFIAEWRDYEERFAEVLVQISLAEPKRQERIGHQGLGVPGGHGCAVRRPAQRPCGLRFGDEARMLQRAVFVPLGPKVEEVLVYLAGRGVVRQDRIIAGLPHPSGANAERIAYFLRRKAREALSAKTNPAVLDDARARLLRQVSGLRV